jgi:hypothetical protein
MLDFKWQSGDTTVKYVMEWAAIGDVYVGWWCWAGGRTLCAGVGDDGHVR